MFLTPFTLHRVSTPPQKALSPQPPAFASNASPQPADDTFTLMRPSNTPRFGAGDRHPASPTEHEKRLIEEFIPKTSSDIAVVRAVKQKLEKHCIETHVPTTSSDITTLKQILETRKEPTSDTSVLLNWIRRVRHPELQENQEEEQTLTPDHDGAAPESSPPTEAHPHAMPALAVNLFAKKRTPEPEPDQEMDLSEDVGEASRPNAIEVTPGNQPKHPKYDYYLTIAQDYMDKKIKPDQKRSYLIADKRIAGRTLAEYHQQLKNFKDLTPEAFADYMTTPQQRLTPNDHMAMARYFKANDKLPNQTMSYILDNGTVIKGKTMYSSYRRWQKSGKPEPEACADQLAVAKQKSTPDDHRAIVRYFKANDKPPNSIADYTLDNDRTINGRTLAEKYHLWVNSQKPDEENFAKQMTRSREPLTPEDRMAIARYFMANDKTPITVQNYTLDNERAIKGRTLYSFYQKWKELGKPEPETFAESSYKTKRLPQPTPNGMDIDEQ